MAPLYWAVAYVLVHFALYALLLRRLPSFSREAVVFLYHAVAAVLLCAVVALSLVVSPAVDAVATGAAIVAIQGIYSVSFLELWSLAEGGYSLTILRSIALHNQREAKIDLDTMRNVAATKKENRVRALLNLGLVRQEPDRLKLTGRGRTVARILIAISWLPDGRST